MVVLGVLAAPVAAAPFATSATASPAPASKGAAAVADEQFISSNGSVVSAAEFAREAGSSSSAPSYRGTNTPISTVQRRTPSTTGAGGGSAAETPIAPDRRVQITATTSYPNRAVVWITFKTTATSGTSSCTGFMIAPNVVATAGHCVNFGANGGSGFFNKPSFQIFPGRSGSSSPYLCPGNTVAKASQLWTNSTWNSSGAETHDYGAITLSCNIGDTTGYFGWTTSSQAVGNAVDTQGYPGDKPSGTQWDADNCSTSTTSTSFVQCTIQATSSTQMFYRNDTAGGQSGSPLFTVTSSSCTCAIGIHAYGLHGSSPHSTNNHGTRVNTTVANFFSLMRNGGLV
ncbi:trypsin-like serine peptidase [Nocardioides antri]|nr:trypsin-like serine protease [Nocardioides antri]